MMVCDLRDSFRLSTPNTGWTNSFDLEARAVDLRQHFQSKQTVTILVHMTNLHHHSSEKESQSTLSTVWWLIWWWSNEVRCQYSTILYLRTNKMSYILLYSHLDSGITAGYSSVHWTSVDCDFAHICQTVTFINTGEILPFILWWWLK